MAYRDPAIEAPSLEGGLAATYVGMPGDEARDVLRREFALDGTLTRLATEKDDTFRVECGDGRRFILKIANPSEDVGEIELQVGLLRHVETADPALPVPRMVANAGGRVQFPITDRAGQVRQTRLMTYLDGTPLDSTASSAGEREHVGRVLARLRLATAGYAHPADTRVLAWDVAHLPTLAPLLAQIDCDARRAKLAAGLERFASLESRIRALRRQVLHNDFSKSNIVVSHDAPGFVTGIIDFGDAVRTAIAIDVSTALLNQLPRDAAEHPVDDLFADGRDLLRGYLAVADLTDDELALIPHLTMGRVVARALITLWRARMFPENATYILRNTEQGWAQLDWFLARPIDAVSETLFS